MGFVVDGAGASFGSSTPLAKVAIFFPSGTSLRCHEGNKVRSLRHPLGVAKADRALVARENRAIYVLADRAIKYLVNDRLFFWVGFKENFAWLFPQVMAFTNRETLLWEEFYFGLPPFSVKVWVVHNSHAFRLACADAPAFVGDVSSCSFPRSFFKIFYGECACGSFVEAG